MLISKESSSLFMNFKKLGGKLIVKHDTRERKNLLKLYINILYYKYCIYYIIIHIYIYIYIYIYVCIFLYMTIRKKEIENFIPIFIMHTYNIYIYMFSISFFLIIT